MNKQIFKAFLILAGLVIAAAGWLMYFLYQWQNPDMTDLRLFLSNPWPTCLCLLGGSMTIASTSIK